MKSSLWVGPQMGTGDPALDLGGLTFPTWGGLGLPFSLPALVGEGTFPVRPFFSPTHLPLPPPSPTPFYLVPPSM